MIERYMMYERKKERKNERTRKKRRYATNNNNNDVNDDEIDKQNDGPQRFRISLIFIRHFR
jgi:hypothetical protein